MSFVKLQWNLLKSYMHIYMKMKKFASQKLIWNWHQNMKNNILKISKDDLFPENLDKIIENAIHL